jgi:ribosomal protein S18 acetylase RimI-like enzyme
MLRDAIPEREDEPLRQLLAYSVGFPDGAKVARRLAEYRGQPDRRLLVYEADGRILGSLGLQFIASGAASIRHIAVFPEHRGRGVGRGMVRQAWEHFALHRLTAETDADAVGFYRRCGFAVTSLGEKWPGIERFDCEFTGVPVPAPGRGE